MPLSNTGTDRFLAQNYYSKSQLNSGQLDTRYFAESEHINTSAGAGDAGKPIKLNASGKVDITMIPTSGIDHGGLTGLGDDDHAQYALLAGRSGGQSLVGGTASGNNLTLSSTAHATKGKVILGSASAYDQVNDRLGLGTTSPSVTFHVAGSDANGVRTLLANAQGGADISTYATGTTAYSISGWADAGVIESGTGASGGLVLSAYAGPIILQTGAQTTRFTLSATGDVTMTGALAVTGNITQNSVAVVTTSGTQTLTNKTLTTPTIGSFTNATHAHTGASSGGQLDHTTALTNVGSNTHSQIDTHIAGSAAHGASGAIVGTTNTQTLTNKTLTTPIISTLYGGSAANDDITIEGTAHATKTSSYVILQPTGGNVAVGGTTTDWKMEVAEGNFRIAFNPGFGSATNYISSYNSAVGVQTAAPLSLFGSRVSIDSGIFNINTGNAPASAAASGTTGDVAWDTSYLYICTNTNTWRRIAHATW